VPAIDWTWPAERINAVLLALFVSVQFDAQMRPFRAEWLVPEWRAPDGAVNVTGGRDPGDRP